MLEEFLSDVMGLCSCAFNCSQRESVCCQGLRDCSHTDALASEKTRSYQAQNQIGPQLPPGKEDVVQQQLESPQRRVKGPIRPPQEFLDASSVLSDEPIVGPMPIFGEDIDFEHPSDNLRFEEAARVLATADNITFVDSFTVLGLDGAAGDSDVKRKYWRLSLLVHPDKCSHPRAQEVHTIPETLPGRLIC